MTNPENLVSAEIIAAAVFDFGGFLTSREEVLEIGASRDAAPMVEAIGQWMELRKVKAATDRILNWRDSVGDAI